MTEWQTAYRASVNAERLARQAEPVRKTIKDILNELKSIEQYLYWALDPEENDPSYFALCLTEHAHALVDLGHEYKAAIKANPPPPEEDENDQNIRLTSTR